MQLSEVGDLNTATLYSKPLLHVVAMCTDPGAINNQIITNLAHFSKLRVYIWKP